VQALAARLLLVLQEPVAVVVVAAVVVVFQAQAAFRVLAGAERKQSKHLVFSERRTRQTRLAEPPNARHRCRM
jgi:hypothetical protein